MASKPSWLPWVALGLLIIGGGAVVYKLTRGIRNNNPGNIRKTGIKWQGLAPAEQQTDPDFAVFIAPEWGIRAMVKDLRGDWREGKRTVEALINEWAPPVENDTGSYVRAVASALGVTPDAPLNLDDTATLTALVASIIRHENGVQPYSADVLARGLALANA